MRTLFKKPFAWLFGLGLTLSMAQAQAGFVTTHEAEMDAIFSQASFGSNAIDIRFNPVQYLVNSSLTSIDSDAEVNQIFSINSFFSKTIDMFFVDSINYCGGPGANIIGCGLLSGNSFMVESAWAAGSTGAALNAHELGHNLGLGHDNVNTNNLMYPVLFGGTFLSVAQANSILTSDLVQIDQFGHRYVQINPIAVVATAVPEPESWALLAIGLVGLALKRRQLRTQA